MKNLLDRLLGRTQISDPEVIHSDLILALEEAQDELAKFSGSLVLREEQRLVSYPCETQAKDTFRLSTPNGLWFPAKLELNASGYNWRGNPHLEDNSPGKIFCESRPTLVELREAMERGYFRITLSTVKWWVPESIIFNELIELPGNKQPKLKPYQPTTLEQEVLNGQRMTVT